jgi:hypothetical protein
MARSIFQTSVSQDPAKAYEGQVENPESAEIITKVAEAALDSGLGCKQGADDKGCLGVSGATDVTGRGFLGITIYDPSKCPTWPSGVTKPYPIGQLVSILRRGRIWVFVEEAVTPASAPFCRITANGGNTVLGRFRASADGGNAEAMSASRFVTSAGAGGLALLEVNLP